VASSHYHAWIGIHSSGMAYRITASVPKVWIAVVGMKDECRVKDPARLDARAHAMSALWFQ
jgi:hypothetical protein